MDETTQEYETIVLKASMRTIELAEVQMTSGLLADENAKLTTKLEDFQMICKYWIDENDKLMIEL